MCKLSLNPAMVLMYSSMLQCWAVRLNVRCLGHRDITFMNYTIISEVVPYKGKVKPHFGCSHSFSVIHCFSLSLSLSPFLFVLYTCLIFPLNYLCSKLETSFNATTASASTPDLCITELFNSVTLVLIRIGKESP